MKLTKTWFKSEIEVNISELNDLTYFNPHKVEVLSRIFSRFLNSVIRPHRVNYFKVGEDDIKGDFDLKVDIDKIHKEGE